MHTEPRRARKEGHRLGNTGFPQTMNSHLSQYRHRHPSVVLSVLTRSSCRCAMCICSAAYQASWIGSLTVLCDLYDVTPQKSTEAFDGLRRTSARAPPCVTVSVRYSPMRLLRQTPSSSTSLHSGIPSHLAKAVSCVTLSYVTDVGK